MNITSEDRFARAPAGDVSRKSPRSCRREGRAPVDGRRGGFSLIEMLGVLVVLSIIATIVTANWVSILPKEDLHTAVRTLSETLGGTRSDAIARNALFQVQYDLEESRYRVITPFKVTGGLAVTNEERRALAWVPLPKTVKFQTITVDGVEYRRGMVFVRFDPLGTASGHTIVLVQSPTENRYTIEVQGLLGLIDYHEGVYARPLPKESDFK